MERVETSNVKPITAKLSSHIILCLKSLWYLVKGRVLLANTLPALLGFWLCLRVHKLDFAAYAGTFLLLWAGCLLLIAGALILNNWFEADVDSRMQRTQNRPTVTGSMSSIFVIWLGTLTTAAGSAVLLYLQVEALLYGMIGWFLYVICYTVWSKRRFTWNTLIGSMSGAVTPLIGWAVLDPQLAIAPLTFVLLLFLWQIPHTYAIVCKRYNDYKASGLSMLPVVKGIKTARYHMIFYIILLLLLIPFYPLSGSGKIISILLTAAWLLQTASGRYSNQKRWANTNFQFSIAYLQIHLLLFFLAYV